jgi:S1-C subfamily serine protease
MNLRPFLVAFFCGTFICQTVTAAPARDHTKIWAEIRALLLTHNEAHLPRVKSLLEQLIADGDTQAQAPLSALKNAHPSLFEGADILATPAGWQPGRPPNFAQVQSSGSSVAITPNGQFLTNAHVVEKCKALVVMYQGGWAAGKTTTLETGHDVAIVSVPAATPKYAKIEFDPPNIGEKVMTGGWPVWDISERNDNPIAPINTIKVSEGIISGSFGEKTFSMTAPISSGNSGGPILSEYGALRGISVSGLVSGSYKGNSWSGTYFGIPTTIVLQLLKGQYPVTQNNNKTNKLSSETIARVAKNVSALIYCY